VRKRSAVILRDAEVEHVMAGGRRKRAKQRAIAVVGAACRKVCRSIDQFIAGRKHADLQATHHIE
jgi:hypothetical protein